MSLQFESDLKVLSAKFVLGVSPYTFFSTHESLGVERTVLIKLNGVGLAFICSGLMTWLSAGYLQSEFEAHPEFAVESYFKLEGFSVHSELSFTDEPSSFLQSEFDDHPEFPDNSNIEFYGFSVQSEEALAKVSVKSTFWL